MSAIFGVYYLEGKPIDSTHLGRMAEVLAHRGHDNADIWIEESVGMGHRMLWTTPESLLEKLPLVSSTGNLVITADARIDNRDELISALQLNDQASAKITDSQLILSAYEKWGEQCPEKLLGDFAFVIWDKYQQILFCARDIMGVRPFYYYHSSQIFVFASEIKGLLCLPEVPRRLNELRIGQYLARIFEDRETTFYEDILRLPAAHSLVIGIETKQIRRYWSLDPSLEIRLSSNQEYAEAYREIFTEAVRCRLRSAFPVGSMLSGGLDSSSITCVARNILSQQKHQELHTFSAIFPNLKTEYLQLIDERFYVDLVVAQDGIVPHYIEADSISPLTDYDQIFWYMDEGFCAPNIYLNWLIYQKVREKNVRIILDGIDGDTTISHGQAYLTDLIRRLQFKTFLKEARAYALRFYLPWMQVIWQWGLQPLIPEFVWKISGKPIWMDTAINPAFAKRLNLSDYFKEQQQKNSHTSVTARELHWHSLNSGLIQYALEMADKLSSACSVSLSFPFCDRRLMEFCLAIPPEQKFSSGWTRLVARRAMAGILPPELQTRITKANLGASFKPKFLEFEHRILDEIIIKNPKNIEDYVDISALRMAYSRYLSDPMQEQDAMTVYTVVNLAAWLQKIQS
ncbi:lasso peptide isopeptide bond-forming cyclase [Fortiea sp. LEGE XX443]|uniref:lasso peptide isopeptide bond-forming cyclase n=1 Tax=Fortiea sp. LEGE XX443 TaxID=1828611 RepID=UPI00187E587C|nr:lasso peptide isopeptide bond-forming cyclase [Fortiea sp. LEGE XX443]